MVRPGAVLAAFLLVGSCGDDDSGTNPAIGVSASPGSINVEVGGSGTATATISRTGGYSQAVSLTSSGAPAGMTIGFNPQSVSAATQASTIEVTVANSVAPGMYTITITASGLNVSDATDEFTVVVITAAAGGFTLSPASASLAATAGGASVGTAITVTRTAPFTGAVGLTVTGMPTGMTATLDPTSVTGTTSTLTVQAGSGTATGTYPLTVRGSASGVADRTTVVNVTVTGSGGTFTATVTFCASDAPVWAARQDGTGNWERVSPLAGTTTYQFSFTQGRGGIALVDTVGAGTDLSVIYGTTADFGNLADVQSFGGCGVKTLNGTVGGLSATDIATVSMAFSTQFLSGATGSAYQLTGVPDGPQDLVAARASVAGGTPVTNSIILRRLVDSSNNANLPLLDFNGTEAVAPALANVTTSNLGPDTLTIQSVFNGNRGSAFGIVALLDEYVAALGAQQYAAVPVSLLGGGDIQLLQGSGSTAGTPTSSRSAGVYFRSAANRTLAFGPVLTAPTVTKAATTPVARPRVQLPVQAEYGRFLSASYNQGTLNRTVNVSATGAYFGAPSAWDLTMPDLSAVTGWQNAWGLADGTLIEWTVTGTGGVTPFLDTSIADGSTTQSATQEGNL
jgi:hypothetical protein